MINVIIINGAPRSGKDTFVKYCKQYCNDYEYAWVINYSTVDKLKDMLRELGWDGSEDTKPRKLLADMKQFWANGSIRDVVDNVMKIYDDHSDEDVIFFVHCREPLEINKIKSVLESLSIAYPISVSTLIVHRLEAEREAFTNEADSHTSEYAYDIEVWNNGTLSDLKKNADNFCEKLLEV